jgi:hypothetical protein
MSNIATIRTKIEGWKAPLFGCADVKKSLDTVR